MPSKCSRCGESLRWYDAKCPRCGATVEIVAPETPISLPNFTTSQTDSSAKTAASNAFAETFAAATIAAARSKARDESNANASQAPTTQDVPLSVSRPKFQSTLPAAPTRDRSQFSFVAPPLVAAQTTPNDAPPGPDVPDALPEPQTAANVETPSPDVPDALPEPQTAANVETPSPDVPDALPEPQTTTNVETPSPDVPDALPEPQTAANVAPANGGSSQASARPSDDEPEPAATRKPRAAQTTKTTTAKKRAAKSDDAPTDEEQAPEKPKTPRKRRTAKTKDDASEATPTAKEQTPEKPQKPKSPRKRRAVKTEDDASTPEASAAEPTRTPPPPEEPVAEPPAAPVPPSQAESPQAPTRRDAEEYILDELSETPKAESKPEVEQTAREREDETGDTALDALKAKQSGVEQEIASLRAQANAVYAQRVALDRKLRRLSREIDYLEQERDRVNLTAMSRNESAARRQSALAGFAAENDENRAARPLPLPDEREPFWRRARAVWQELRRVGFHTVVFPRDAFVRFAAAIVAETIVCFPCGIIAAYFLLRGEEKTMRADYTAARAYGDRAANALRVGGAILAGGLCLFVFYVLFNQPVDDSLFTPDPDQIYNR